MPIDSANLLNRLRELHSMLCPGRLYRYRLSSAKCVKWCERHLRREISRGVASPTWTQGRCPLCIAAAESELAGIVRALEVSS